MTATDVTMFAIPWRRMALAILVCTVLSVASELRVSGLTGVEDMPSVVLGTLFYALVYAVSVFVLYFISIGAAQLRIPAWITFPVAFVLIAGSLSYNSMSAYEDYEQGGVSYVVDHHFTAAGWDDFDCRMMENFVIASLAGAVIFCRSKIARSID